MAAELTRSYDADVRRVQDMFEAWRDTSRRGDPVPDALWRAAVSLCSNRTGNEVAKALNIKPARLYNKIIQLRGESVEVEEMGPEPESEIPSVSEDESVYHWWITHGDLRIEIFYTGEGKPPFIPLLKWEALINAYNKWVE